MPNRGINKNRAEIRHIRRTRQSALHAGWIEPIGNSAACTIASRKTHGPFYEKQNLDRKKVLILGGGFGGLTLVRKLKHLAASILLMDKENHHFFQPLLYQVATGALAAPNIAQPLRTIFRARPEVKTLMTEVEDIDLKGKIVISDKRRHPYNYMVLPLGSRINYFGNDHWAQHAPGLKKLADAHQIRNQFLASFERAENGTEDEEERKRLMSCVVPITSINLLIAGIDWKTSTYTAQGNIRATGIRGDHIRLVAEMLNCPITVGQLSR
ncbi:MAG: FAD-dependent oxidoreductase [Verrucomicrobiia bacterium]